MMNIKYVEHSWEGRQQSIQTLNWNRGGLTRLFGDFNASHWCKWNTLWNIICCNFLWKLHDCTRVLFINFGGKFCNIRLNFSTRKIFTKVRHDMKTKSNVLLLHQVAAKSIERGRRQVEKINRNGFYINCKAFSFSDGWVVSRRP